MASLTITSKDPLKDTMLPVPATLGSAGLEVLVLKDSTLARGQRPTFCVPSALNYKLWLPPGYSGLLVSEDQQIRKESLFGRDN